MTLSEAEGCLRQEGAGLMLTSGAAGANGKCLAHDCGYS